MATSGYLRELAERCRALARQMLDDDLRKTLLDIADEFEKEADALDKEGQGNRSRGK
jgi:hypothetical protein